MWVSGFTPNLFLPSQSSIRGSLSSNAAGSPVEADWGVLVGSSWVFEVWVSEWRKHRAPTEIVKQTLY